MKPGGAVDGGPLFCQQPCKPICKIKRVSSRGMTLDGAFLATDGDDFDCGRHVCDAVSPGTTIKTPR